MAAVDRDRRAGGDDPRAGHVAQGGGLAQREDRVVVAAQVGHGGEAGHQGALGVARADQRLLGRGLGHLLQARVRALLAGDVDVAVDQAGQDEAGLQVDDLAAGLGDVAVGDRAPPCRPGSPGSSAVSTLPEAGVDQHAAGLDEGGGRGLRQRGRDEGGGERRAEDRRSSLDVPQKQICGDPK